MISSIFGKTKPINFFILCGVLLVLYIGMPVFEGNYHFYEHQTGAIILTSIVLVLTILVLDFIVKRNKITESNSYAILFYVLFCIAFPESVASSKFVFCNFFLVLATRRLVSLKSLNDIRLKLYDATIWIVIASLFVDWAALYIVLVFLSILIYEPQIAKNWLVPITGIATVGFIGFAYLKWNQNEALINDHFQFSIQESDFSIQQWMLFGISLLIIVVSVFVTFSQASKTVVGKNNTLRLVAASLVIGLLAAGFSKENSMSSVLFVFFPATIFLTNATELIRKPKAKEIALLIMIIAPFVLLVYRLI